MLNLLSRRGTVVTKDSKCNKFLQNKTRRRNNLRAQRGGWVKTEAKTVLWSPNHGMPKTTAPQGWEIDIEWSF